MPYSSHVPGPDPFPHALFERAARECDDLDILVEVGVGFGHGTCFMMEALMAYAKRPHFYAFDLFDMPNAPGDTVEVDPLTPWGEETAKWKARCGGVGARLDAFLYHIGQSPCRDKLVDWAQFPSWTICDNFVDESVAFAFLNASRQQESVTRELKGWWRTIKPNGRLAIYGVGRDMLLPALGGMRGSVCVTEAQDNTFVITKETL